MGDSTHGLPGCESTIEAVDSRHICESSARTPLKYAGDLSDVMRMKNETSTSEPSRRSYSVYVVELDESKHKAGVLEPLYVGSTALTPEERLAKHLSHERSSRHVRGHAVGLRPELYEQYNPLPTRQEAEAKEAWLANELRALGHDVYSA
jgi:hypothetical protein